MILIILRRSSVQERTIVTRVTNVTNDILEGSYSDPSNSYAIRINKAKCVLSIRRETRGGVMFGLRFVAPHFQLFTFYLDSPFPSFRFIFIRYPYTYVAGDLSNCPIFLRGRMSDFFQWDIILTRQCNILLLKVTSNQIYVFKIGHKISWKGCRNPATLAV